MSIQQYRPQGFNLLPEVVKNLLIINGIFFLATYVLGKQGFDLVDRLGLHYFQSEKFHWYQFITYMFMHGNLPHIALNMFALWMFGAAVENIWGPQKFLTFYIIAGLGAAIAHYAVVYFEIQPGMQLLNNYIYSDTHNVDQLQSLLGSEAFSKFYSSELNDSKAAFIEKFNTMLNVNPDEAFKFSVRYMDDFRQALLNAPVVVGASGAIFGILLAYGMLFPNSLIFIYFIIPLKAKYFVMIYGAIELFGGITQQAGDNVAHFAHLGGLLTGYLLILYWRWKDRNRSNPYGY